MPKRTASQLVVDMIANVGRLQTDMGRAAAVLDGFEKKVNSVATAFKSILPVAGIAAAGYALDKLIDKVNDLADAGEGASSIKEAFDGLGGDSSQIKKAQDAVLGMVDSFDLMQIANEGLIKQIPQFNESFAKISELGGRLANAFNKDTKESIDGVVQALSTAKDKQLREQGIIIDTAKAYHDYGASIGKAGNELTKQQQLIARQIAAVGALDEAISRLAPVTDSVSNAHKAFTVALEEAYKFVGIGVNANAELTRAWRELEQAVKSIDWQKLGTSIGTIAAVIVEQFGPALKTAAGLVNDVATSLDILVGKSQQADVDRMTVKFGELSDQVAEMEKDLSPQGRAQSSVMSRWLFGENDDALQKLKTERDALYDKILKAREAMNNAGKPTGTKPPSPAAGFGDDIDAAAKKLQQFRDQWDQFMRSDMTKSLESQINEAVKNPFVSNLDGLTEELRKSVEQGFIAKWHDAVASGAISLDTVMAEATVKGNEAVKEVFKKVEDHVAEINQKMKEGFANAADDLFGSLSSVADAFGLKLQGIFGALGKYLSLDAKSGIGKSIADALGTDVEGLKAIIGATETVLSSLADVNKLNKSTKSEAGTGGLIGAGGGAAIGSIWGPVGAVIGAEIGKTAGTMIGGLFKWGSQNPETNARHAFSNFVEEGFKKLGQVSFFDKNGKLQNQQGKNFNFLEGSSSSFNTPGWADEMNKWGDKAKNTFQGLGEALKDMQGITEDVAGQIAFLLGKNLAGNIDNARLLVQQLGLSFDDMEKALEDAAERGSISWHEFEVDVAGLGEAFKPGLEALADVKGAVNEIVDSGGRGKAAVKGIKDLAQEAAEAGGKSLEDLQNLMKKQGVDGGLIDSIISSLKQRGISTIQEILNLSDKEAGGIIAQLYSSNQQLAKQWDEMGDKLKGITETLKDMDDHLQKSLEFDVTSNIDSNTQALLNSGALTDTGADKVVNSIRSMGTIRTPVNSGGTPGNTQSLHASARSAFSPVNIHVDARGAQSGVSAEVHHALSALESRVVQRTLTAVYDARNRGAF